MHFSPLDRPRICTVENHQVKHKGWQTCSFCWCSMSDIGAGVLWSLRLLQNPGEQEGTAWLYLLVGFWVLAMALSGLCRWFIFFFCGGPIGSHSKWQEVQLDFLLLLTLSLHKALLHCLKLHRYGVKLISTLRGFLVLKSNVHLAGSSYSSACNLSFLDFETFCLSGIFSNSFVLKKMTSCWCTVCELSI